MIFTYYETISRVKIRIEHLRWKQGCFCGRQNGIPNPEVYVCVQTYKNGFFLVHRTQYGGLEQYCTWTALMIIA